MRRYQDSVSRQRSRLETSRYARPCCLTPSTGEPVGKRLSADEPARVALAPTVRRECAGPVRCISAHAAGNAACVNRNCFPCASRILALANERPSSAAGWRGPTGCSDLKTQRRKSGLRPDARSTDRNRKSSGVWCSSNRNPQQVARCCAFCTCPDKVGATGAARPESPVRAPRLAECARRGFFSQFQCGMQVRGQADNRS